MSDVSSKPAKTLISRLAALLAVQLVLVLVLQVTSQHYSPTELNTPLVKADIAAADKIEMINGPLAYEGKNLKTVIEQKTAKHWTLTSFDDLPVSTADIANLLGELKDAKAGLPVSTTDGSAERFQLAKDNFHRELIVYQKGSPLVDLIFGSSPGVKVLYVRHKDSSTIYSVAFREKDVNPDPNFWFDKDLLQTLGTDVTGADYGVCRVEQVGGSWRLLVDDKQQLLAIKTAQWLIGNLAGINLQGVLEKNAPPPSKECLGTYKLLTKTGGAKEFKFYASNTPQQYVLKCSSDPHYFLVSAATYDKLNKVSVASVLKEDAKNVADEKAGKKSPGSPTLKPVLMPEHK